MIRNDAFYIQQTGKIKYLIPVGQMKSDKKKCTIINSTGEYIWNLLEDDLTEQEIIDKSIEYFEVSEDEKEEFTNDICSYLKELRINSIIVEREMEPQNYLENINSIVIANIKLSFYGDKSIYPDKFTEFESMDRRMEDVRVELVNSSLEFDLDRKLLVENELLRVVETNDRYMLSFPQSKEVYGCQIKKDGRLVRIHAFHKLSEEGIQLVFDSIRVAFLYKALNYGYVAIHSASILYNNKAWLFTAPSGTGKSTHANLWKESFGVNTINGDLNLVALDNEKPVIYGTPWCGTSNIYDNEEHELGGVIILKRNEKNFIEELPLEDKILLVSQRAVSPAWNKNMMEEQFKTVADLTEKILIARLNCNKESEAAVVIKQYIDKTQ